MSGGNDFSEAALWRRWRDTADAAGEAAAEPDALALAAYAERRLGRPGADPETEPRVAAVEAWLAGHPEYFDDIAAAREVSTAAADPALIAHAQALVPRAEGKVTMLRPSRGGWRKAAAWSGIAASMIGAVLVGFTLGTSDLMTAPDTAQNQGLEQALIGPSTTTILAGDDEESGT